MGMWEGEGMCDGEGIWEGVGICEGVLGVDGEAPVAGEEGDGRRLPELGPFKSATDLRLLFLRDARDPEGGEADNGEDDTA